MARSWSASSCETRVTLRPRVRSQNALKLGGGSDSSSPRSSAARSSAAAVASHAMAVEAVAEVASDGAPPPPPAHPIAALPSAPPSESVDGGRAGAGMGGSASPAPGRGQRATVPTTSRMPSEKGDGLPASLSRAQRSASARRACTHAPSSASKYPPGCAPTREGGSESRPICSRPALACSRCSRLKASLTMQRRRA